MNKTQIIRMVCILLSGYMTFLALRFWGLFIAGSFASISPPTLPIQAITLVVYGCALGAAFIRWNSLQIIFYCFLATMFALLLNISMLLYAFLTAPTFNISLFGFFLICIRITISSIFYLRLKGLKPTSNK